MPLPTDRSDCPPRNRLVAFSQGRLAEAELDRIVDHLDGCPQCEESLRSVGDEGDTVIAAVRSALQRQRVDDAVLVGLLAERVKQVQLAGRKRGDIEAREQAIVEERPPAQLGPYRLQEKIGRGGMGTVYKAFHVNLKRVVALKLLPLARSHEPRFVRRFYVEMEAVGKLDHPHVVRATDAGEDQGHHFLAMEYVEGIDLSRLLRRVGPLDCADACEIACQVARGLSYIQQHGLVHRDLKPSNLLLSGGGAVKILDLGLARLASHDLQHSSLTSSHQVLGTVDYVAPEQVTREQDVDIRADIYSLGCTLFKLLTGRAPFATAEYSTLPAKLMAHCHRPPPPLQSRRGDLPPQLHACISRMLAKRPEDRYQDPAEIAAASRLTAGRRRPAADAQRPSPDAAGI